MYSTIETVILVLAIIYFLIIPSFKTGVFPVVKLIITPAIFLYMNFSSLQRHFHVQPASVGILLAGVILGIAVGAFFRSKSAVRADREKKLIEVAGSYMPLVMFIAIFSVHFAIGWIESVNPGYLLQVNNTAKWLMFLLTLTSCSSLGGAGCLFYKFMTAKSTPLVET